MLRCKMRFVSVKHAVAMSGELSQVELEAVAVYGDGANAEWSKWTPSGRLTLSVTNPQAFGLFKPGDMVYVDLSRVETEE